MSDDNRGGPPMSDPYADIPPDDKDWTWVLDETCPECGYRTEDVPRNDLPTRIREAVLCWQAVLGRPDCVERPSRAVWSPVEYACHVRDACLVFDGRFRLMLTEDDPLFDNWDQDVAAAGANYGSQEPILVATELAAAFESVATTLDFVDGDQWARPGRRSDGSVFTVESMGSYLLHDLVHHEHDVSRSA